MYDKENVIHKWNEKKTYTKKTFVEVVMQRSCSRLMNIFSCTAISLNWNHLSGISSLTFIYMDIEQSIRARLFLNLSFSNQYLFLLQCSPNKHFKYIRTHTYTRADLKPNSGLKSNQFTNIEWYASTTYSNEAVFYRLAAIWKWNGWDFYRLNKFNKQNIEIRIKRNKEPTKE